MNLLPQTISARASSRPGARLQPPVLNLKPAPLVPSSRAGFTMVEIAICLAVIGIALVAIIGVLPIGLNAQRDSREDTFISQDASVLIDAIRSGAIGLNDLTNYVIGITNTQTYYSYSSSASAIVPGATHVYGYTYNGVTVDGSVNGSYAAYALFSATNIIGLLSTPLYINTNSMVVGDLNSGGYSNHIVAYFHSISGPVVEKPPQDNALLVNDSFGYRVVLENAPPAPVPGSSSYGYQLGFNQHELRLSFTWPILPNGKISTQNQPQTFRATIAGQIVPDLNSLGANNLYQRYFYQAQSFAPNTNAP